jgi:hypothetical protein
VSDSSKSAQQSAAETAAKVLAGEMGVIGGSVRLASLAHEAVKDWRVDPDFVVFGALASETDHLPTGSARQHWNPAALAEADIRIARIENEARHDVFRACRSVIKRFTDELLQHLRMLEVTLHQPAVRRDSSRLALLLHDEFIEIGRSGRRYTRENVLREFSETSSPAVIWSQDYALMKLNENFVLLTYKSAHIDSNGALSRHTLRSSLWQQVNGDWQLRFHQGTPTDAFQKTAT